MTFRCTPQASKNVEYHGVAFLFASQTRWHMHLSSLTLRHLMSVLSILHMHPSSAVP